MKCRHFECHLLLCICRVVIRFTFELNSFDSIQGIYLGRKIMPSCCIKQCGARKTNNQPTLTLHRFPANKDLRRKWIQVIGVENINPKHKMWFVCSMHFHPTSFNKTLDVMRLHDNVAPLSFLPTPRPRRSRIKVTLESASPDSEDYLGKQCLKLEESEEENGHPQHSLSVSSEPVRSVDKNSKRLFHTKDAPSSNILPEDHNYTLKCESHKITSPAITRDESLADSDYQGDDEDTVSKSKPHNTNNNSNKAISESYLNKKAKEEYERIKMIEYSNRQKNRIKQLQRKVKILQGRLRRSKENQEKIKILSRSVKSYTRFSEIDNILSGRFKELCKVVTSNTPKKIDYTPDVINFAITLYYLSPKAYNFIKKYMDLPHTNILLKYLASGTYIINLDE